MAKQGGVLSGGIGLCFAAGPLIASLLAFAGVGPQEAMGLRPGQVLLLTFLVLSALGFVLCRLTRRAAAPSPVTIKTDTEAANPDPSPTPGAPTGTGAQQPTDEFLAELVHELRDPLNGILGFAQLLERDATLHPEAHGHAVWIRRSGEHLLTLVNDILEMAKIDAGHLEIVPEVWETTPFFEELCFLAGSRAKRKGVRFRYEPDGTLPPRLRADPRPLRHIALNLLDNAIKFTECGEIILRGGVEEGRLWIEVRDTGIGIAPEGLARIFQPFGQAGEGRYNALGSGLGLALAHRLTEAMGGTLAVTSTLGVGSSFRMEVAVRTPPEPSRKGAPDSVTGYRRTRGEGAFRVLVVDDEPISRMLLSGLLEPLGFVVTVVGDGHSCLDLLPSLAPDLILMDHQMPGLNGQETTRRLHALGPIQPPPVVLISGEDSPEGPGAGYAARLAKPFHLGELLEVIATQLPLEWQYRASAEPCRTYPSAPPLGANHPFSRSQS